MSRAAKPVALGLLFLLAATQLAAQAPKKPVTHADYDIWNTASGTTLSPDGKFLAYTFVPGVGDGAIVVRNLGSGAEHRIPSGGKSETVAAEVGEPGAPPTPPGPPTGGPPGAAAPASVLRFTPDSKRLVVMLAPPRSAVDKAKADKKEAPKAVLTIVEIGTGQVSAKIEKAKGFTVVGAGAGYLVYHKEPQTEDQPKGEAKEQAPPPQPAGGGVRRFGGQGGQGGSGRPTGATRPTVGAELVVRSLADGSETSFADVTEFSVTKDAKQLVYAVASKTADQSGVYVAQLGSASSAPAKTGPGKYTRLVWDETQTKLAFFFTEPAATASSSSTTGKDSSGTTTTPPAPPKLHVFVWDRTAKPQVAANPMGAAASSAVSVTLAKTTPAVEVLGPTVAGLKAGFVVVERGGLRFTADGTKLELATAPATVREPVTEPTPAPSAVAGPAGRFGAVRSDPDRVELDIWHWKDDAVQPMQKVRSNADRMKTFRAVLLLDTKQFKQLSDEDVDVSVPGHGDWGLAASDKAYRGQQWLSPNPRDYALLNVRTGEGKPVLKAQEFAPNRSPKGKWLLAWDGKDWTSVSVPEGKKTNLTAKLGVKFFNEDYDSPSTTPAYGVVGWTADEKFVLLSDRYDIWKVAADGGGTENLTKTGREMKVRFRYVRLAEPEDGEERDRFSIDLSKPMLLAAENLETRDTGFFRLEPGGKPKMLVMGARKYGTGNNPLAPPLVKAKHADVYLFQVSTFYDHPDYYTADRDFREIKRVTDINPKVREFNWGKAELVHYKSADGVPLSGVLIKPEDFDPAKKYPMIVYIYERLSQGLHNFTLPRQGTSINPTYYASNGYLVFMPDIAYTVGSPGQSALKCVLPAIQAVVDKGCVNEAAIGIQGHSWGGYQIAYLVTQTNRFKAAAAGAPVANMTSAYGGIRWGTGLPRQFQYEHTQSRIGASLWQAPLKYLENSPLFMADRVRTPLLMLHNDNDDAVPWYQGIEYYLALRRLGKEVYLLNYNGEPHGLRKKANQRDYTMRMQQFFDHHLKGAPAPEWMAKGVPYNDRDKEKEQWKKLFGKG